MTLESQLGEIPSLVVAERPVLGRIGAPRGSRPRGSSWASAVLCGAQEVALHGQRGGARRVAGRCGTSACVHTCQPKQISGSLDAVAFMAPYVPSDARFWFGRITSPERIVDVEGSNAFGRSVAKFFRSMFRVDVATGIRAYGAAVVFEAVDKPGEVSKVPCPVCVSVDRANWPAPLVERDRLARRELRALADSIGWPHCLVCLGRGVLPGAHIHAHFILAAPPMWWGVSTIPEARQELEALESGAAWRIRDKQPAYLPLPSDPSPFAAVERLARTRRGIEAAEREGWQVTADGRGFGALIKRYGLGHSHIELIEGGLDAAVGYLRKVTRYMSKVNGEDLSRAELIGIGLRHQARFSGMRTVRTIGMFSGVSCKVTRAGVTGISFGRGVGLPPLAEDPVTLGVGPVKVVSVGPFRTLRTIRPVAPAHQPFVRVVRVADCLRVGARYLRVGAAGFVGVAKRRRVRMKRLFVRPVWRLRSPVEYTDRALPAGAVVLPPSSAPPRSRSVHGLRWARLGGRDRWVRAEDLSPSSIALLPRQRPVWRRLQDLGSPDWSKSSAVVDTGIDGRALVAPALPGSLTFVRKSGLRVRHARAVKRAIAALDRLAVKRARVEHLDAIAADVAAGRRRRGPALERARAGARRALQLALVRSESASALEVVRRPGARVARAACDGVWCVATGAAVTVGVGARVAGFVREVVDLAVVLARVREILRVARPCNARAYFLGRMSVYRALVCCARVRSVFPLYALAGSHI